MYLDCVSDVCFKTGRRYWIDFAYNWVSVKLVFIPNFIRFFCTSNWQVFQKYVSPCFICMKIRLHAAICRVRLFWRTKITTDATIPRHLAINPQRVETRSAGPPSLKSARNSNKTSQLNDTSRLVANLNGNRRNTWRHHFAPASAWT